MYILQLALEFDQYLRKLSSMGHSGRNEDVECHDTVDEGFAVLSENRLSNPLVIRDEAAALRLVEQHVRDQMIELVSPMWAHHSQQMLHFTYQTCASHGWFEEWNQSSAIVCIRAGLDQEVFPKGVPDEGQLADLANLLNADVCFLMTTGLVSEYIRLIPAGTMEIQVESELCIQVRRDLNDFRHSSKHQHAAFIRSSGQILFWDDEFQSIIPLALRIEDAIISRMSSVVTDTGTESEAAKEVLRLELAEEMSRNVNRPTQILLAFMVFSAILLNFLIIALAVRAIVFESLRTGNWYRFAILLYFPFVFFLTSFFALMLVVIMIHFFGPVSQLFQNSKFYSCIPPRRITRDFPHITIQCPVYKEDLAEVIVPTVRSLRKAIATYERQGGTASIFINDDGLQLISPEERELRKLYYKLNNIGWVARPGHGKNGFGKLPICYEQFFKLILVSASRQVQKGL